jgi:hypothetical protein
MDRAISSQTHLEITATEETLARARARGFRQAVPEAVRHRERTFYELNRRLSPSVKSALVEFVRALARIG